MKSKKIVAMIVAFAAFMAVATSGLAAVTTTTEYYINDINKVSVEVAVTSAAAGSEVTYLVESGDDIVYIDQQTADGNGAVNFNYKISKGKLTGYAATVKFGTDGNKPIDYAADDNIAFNGITANIGNNVDVTFYLDVACNSAVDLEDIKVGDKDVIYALVDFAEGYELDTMSGLEPASGDVYKVSNINNVVVTAKEKYTAPCVSLPTEEDLSSDVAADYEANFDKVDGPSTVKFLKVVGNPTTEFGIKCKNPDNAEEEWEFPALKGDFDTSDVDFYAVRIMLGDKVIDTFESYMK